MLDGPADEPWPACEEPHLSNESVLVPLEIRTRPKAGSPLSVPEDGSTRHTAGSTAAPRGANLDRSEHPPYPMIGVVHALARDVPEMPFPRGSALFQLLWRPDKRDKPWHGPRLVAAAVCRAS